MLFLFCCKFSQGSCYNRQKHWNYKLHSRGKMTTASKTYKHGISQFYSHNRVTSYFHVKPLVITQNNYYHKTLLDYN